MLSIDTIKPAPVRWVRIAWHRIWMASLWGQVAYWKEESRIAREDHRTVSEISHHWFNRYRELIRSEFDAKHQLNKCKDELNKKTEEFKMLT